MPIDEIIVKGQKPPRPGGADDYIRLTIEQQKKGLPPSPTWGFLAPALTPAIEEIIVTAPKPGPASIVTKLGVGSAAGWLLGAVLGVYELDKYRRQLENEKDYESKRDAEKRRMNRLALEKPLPEVTVTAPKAFAPPAEPYVLPQIQPLITPDFDPFIMVPFAPVVMPQVAIPAAIPAIEIPPITAPQIPRVTPTTTPRRVAVPFSIPWQTPLPQTRPTTQPARRVSPQTVPQTRPTTKPATQPRTSTRPRVDPRTRSVPRTRDLTQSQAQELSLPSLQSGTKKCPPCTKEKKKPRTKCFKKLVKEHLYPDKDTSYNWTQIDCLTGREL
jgi:hypothetical protein